MTKITIVSGFLGAGKTTLIKKLLADGFAGERLVLIENEFGEIGIDGGFLQDAGVTVTEMNSGCICCSLVGDFGKALAQVLADYAPDRIVIEPSGVGKLSDVMAAVQRLDVPAETPVQLAGCVAVADATKCRTYLKNFGEFYADQVQNAGAIVLSRTAGLAPETLAETVALLRAQNADAPIVTTPWDALTGAQLIAAMERTSTLASALAAETAAVEQAHTHDEGCCCGEHAHEHGHHGGNCRCGCGEGHDEHTHDPTHGEGCCCGEHAHEHGHHGGDCRCGCGEGHDEHTHDPAHGEGCCGHGHAHSAAHHHADEIFTSFGAETARSYTADALREMLTALDSGAYGVVLRAKGIVPGEDGAWLHFDYVPGEQNVRTGSAEVTGRVCVIGTQLDEPALRNLLRL